MARILGVLWGGAGQLELTVLRVCLLLVLAAIMVFANHVNQAIGDYHCGPYRVIESGACAGMNSYMGLHAVIVFSTMIAIGFMFIIELRVFVVLILALLFTGSSLTVLGLWIAVQYQEVSMSTREVVTISEDAGIFFNAIILIGVSGFFGLLCISRRR